MTRIHITDNCKYEYYPDLDVLKIYIHQRCGWRMFSYWKWCLIYSGHVDILKQAMEVVNSHTNQAHDH